MRKNFTSISNEAPGLSTKRTGSSIDCAACLPSPFLACSGADYPILRILCGVAPVTRQLGKSRTAQPINGLAAATKVIRHERMLFARGETNGPLKKVTHKAHNR